MPLIDGEVGVSAHQNREKVPAKCLDGTLGLVGAFLVWWDALHFDVLLNEELQERRWAFVVEDLELNLMDKVFEELVRARIGCTEARFSARGKELGVDVSFVLRNHDILGTVEGGDWEAAGQVREESFVAKFR